MKGEKSSYFEALQLPDSDKETKNKKKFSSNSTKLKHKSYHQFPELKMESDPTF